MPQLLKREVVSFVQKTFCHRSFPEYSDHLQEMLKDGWKYIGGTSGNDERGNYYECVWQRRE